MFHVPYGNNQKKVRERIVSHLQLALACLSASNTIVTHTQAYLYLLRYRIHLRCGAIVIIVADSNLLDLL